MSEETIPVVLVNGVVAGKDAHACAWITSYRESHNGEWPAYKEVRAGGRERYHLDLSDKDICRGFAMAGRTVRRWRREETPNADERDDR